MAAQPGVVLGRPRALCNAYDECSGLLLDFMALDVVDDGARVWIRSTPREGTELDRGEQDFRCAMLLKTWRRLHQNSELTPLAVHFRYRRPGCATACAAGAHSAHPRVAG